MEYLVRKIEQKDNATVEQIIRTCLIEFGGNHEGLAWADPYLGRLSEVYNGDGACYWVVEDATGKVVGGAGIGPWPSHEGICELQKMYFLPEARGTGAAHKVMNLALEYAKIYYRQCYIETLHNMDAANRFYQKYGFSRLEKPLAETEHYACDVWYIKEL